MIVPDIRQRLTRSDAQLVLALLGDTGADAAASAQETLRDQGFDALLDSPRLLSAVMTSPRGAFASLPLFLYVVTRHAMLQQGEPSRAMADLVGSILLKFSFGKRAVRIADVDDEVFDTMATLLVASHGGDARRAFMARAHLGNYALWLSGMFPDRIEHLRWRRGAPGLEYFEEMGRRGWRLAAEHRLAGAHGLTPLFADAADRFDTLRKALNRVSDTLLFPRVHTPERLMRQVKDEVRWRAA